MHETMEESLQGSAAAIRHVEECIARGRYEPGDRLPGIRSLALDAGVSPRTMWKALAMLRKAGVVAGAPRKRFTVASPAAKAAVNGHEPLTGKTLDPFAGAVWHRLRAALEREIATGAYPPGKALPGVKQLRARYGVNARTLTKALINLAGDGMLVPHGRGFAAPFLGHHSAAGLRIMLLANGGKTPGFATGHLDSDYVRRLEAACALAGVGLELAVFFVDADDRLIIVDQATGKGRTPAPSDDVAGYVYLIYSRPCLREELLGMLEHTRKPVAVLDGIGQWDRLRHCVHSPRTKIFDIALAAAASRIAAHCLISQGHRQVAYFSPTHKAGWSQRRLDGILTTFARAGFSRAVTRFTLDNEQMADFAAQARQSCDISSLIGNHLKAYRAWRKNAPDEYRRRTDPLFAQPLLYGMYLEGELCREMRKLFALALEHENITAWIMSHDYPAIMALDFLREKKVTVPGKLSVISFDDSFDALKHRLTSYNFNIEGMVQAIMRFLLHPDERGLYARKQRVEIEGFLVYRSTVGPAGS